jgi:hypothetical protein
METPGLSAQQEKQLVQEMSSQRKLMGQQQFTFQDSIQLLDACIRSFQDNPLGRGLRNPSDVLSEVLFESQKAQSKFAKQTKLWGVSLSKQLPPSA